MLVIEKQSKVAEGRLEGTEMSFVAALPFALGGIPPAPTVLQNRPAITMDPPNPIRKLLDLARKAWCWGQAEHRVSINIFRM